MRWPWVSPKEFRGLQGNVKFESENAQIASSPPTTPLHCSETLFLQRVVTTRTMYGMQQAELYLYGTLQEAKITINADKKTMQALEAAVGKRFRLDLAEVADEPKEDQNAR